MTEHEPVAKRTRYQRRFVIGQTVFTLLSRSAQPSCSSDTNMNEAEPEDGPTQASDNGKNLMILIDDCLLKMFDFLKLTDLCQLANVNKRLNILVKSFIQTKYHIKFDKKFHFASHKGRTSVPVAQAFFHIFGNEIETLKLTRDSFDETFNDYHSMSQIFNSLQQHCSNIKELTLQEFGTSGLNCKIFRNLEVLTLEKCSVSRDWCHMNKLKTIRLSEVIFRRWPLQYSSFREYGDPPDPPIPIPTGCFDNLVEARFSDVNISNDALGKFIAKNRSLKILSVVKCLETSPVFFKFLPQLKNLEEFEFKKQTSMNRECEYKYLHNLKKLKTLKMTFHGSSDAQALLAGFSEKGIGIEHLEIRGGQFDDSTVVSIVKLQTLKILKLYNISGLNGSQILRVADGLKQLEEFHLEIESAKIPQNNLLAGIVNAATQLTCLKIVAPSSFSFDLDTFHAMLAVLQKRNEENTFKLTIYGNGEQSLAVPDGILKGENEKWLEVEVLNRNTNCLYENLHSNVGHPPPRPDWTDSDDSDDYDYY